MRKARLREGLPFPCGATWTGLGVNFALFSANASKVELCLFDEQGEKEIERIELPEFTDEVWHGISTGRAAGLNLMDIVFTVPTIRPMAATVSIPISSCSIPMRWRWSAISTGIRAVFSYKMETGETISLSMIATVRPL